MADATPESNLALIEELQSLVSADYAQPEGPEFSYPAVGQAVDDEMWKFITLALGSGILDDGGWPYWLRSLGSDSETNQANQMKLTVATTTNTAQAVLKGFYHRLLEDMRLDFPMPLSETTYYVVLELNPLKARDPEGPIRVKVYPNELNTESGREHLTLWTVTRKPNQLLTDATITRYRPRVAPTLNVLTWEHLPDPATVLYGTVAFVYGDNDIAISRGADNAEGGSTRWDSLLNPKWVDLSDNEYYGWPGHGYHRGYREKSGSVQLRGRISRVTGDNFLVGGSSNAAGYGILTLPERLGPKEELRYVTSTNSYSGNKLAIITVVKSGQVYATPLLGECAWISLDGIEFPLE